MIHNAPTHPKQAHKLKPVKTFLRPMTHLHRTFDGNDRSHTFVRRTHSPNEQREGFDVDEQNVLGDA